MTNCLHNVSKRGEKLGTALHVSPTSLGQLFDQIFRSDFKSPSPWTAPTFAAASLWEDENHFYLEFDLPGVLQENVDVTIDKGVLKVTAERKAPEGERKYWHQERGYGRVERSVELPDTVDPAQVEAELTAGVLHVRLGKRSEAQPKKVTIKGS